MIKQHCQLRLPQRQHSSKARPIFGARGGAAPAREQSSHAWRGPGGGAWLGSLIRGDRYGRARKLAQRSDPGP